MQNENEVNTYLGSRYHTTACKGELRSNLVYFSIMYLPAISFTPINSFLRARAIKERKTSVLNIIICTN